MHAPLSPINLYQHLKQANYTPFLLESRGPHTLLAQRTILGTKHTRKLVSKAGALYEDGRQIGAAVDIFEHLVLPASSAFFPAWMGFFSYEFARNFALPCKDPLQHRPEAVFYLYEEGELWEGPCTDAEAPGNFIVNFSSEDLQGFDAVKQSIKRGDVYQVNLTKPYTFDAQEVDFLALYKRLRQNNPSPFMALIEDDDWAIASASPERLFRYHQGRLSSRPIAGTRKRGASNLEDAALENELLNSAKERAEHAMLVDLVRNDLSQVCEAGSVFVDEAFIVERYSHVMHLVSEVAGRCNAPSLLPIMRALFPAGTITGTPKESAMAHIRDLEPHPRGAYTGSLGYISGRDGADFNILIRSAFKEGTRGQVWAGAGIVAASESRAEEGEVKTKAQSVLQVFSQAPSPSTPDFSKPGLRYSLQRSTSRYSCRVLFVENHDSFSHNIIDAFRRLGCEVDVCDHNQMPELDPQIPVILGPGPKSPSEAGLLMPILASALEKDCAVLGICLGHQAIGAHFGAQLMKARRAIHGEASELLHLGHPLLQQIPSPFVAMRYHSLVLSAVPAELEVIAWSAADEVMAIAHKEKRCFGVQFHPESFLSEGGDQLFANFMAMAS